MYRGTTPTIVLELDTEVSLVNLAEMWVTFKTSTVEVTKLLEDVIIDDTLKTVTVMLSQEETLKLYNGRGSVQIRFRDENDLAYVTEIADLNIGKILKEGVI
jgi:hypothetical protein